MKARLHLFFSVLAAFALALPAPAFASIQPHSPPCPFDGVGNRLARSSNIAAVPTATHTYTANDWLASDSYDSNGNTVNAGGIPDTYDFENRLVTHLYGQIVLVYDGDGNRVKKTVSGV